MRHPLTPARRLRTAGAPATALAIGLLAGVPAPAQDIDVCGCEDMPSFGDFNNCASSSTWPPGSYVSGATVVVPLPADGVVVFERKGARGRKYVSVHTG